MHEMACQSHVDDAPLKIVFVSKEFPPSPRSYGIGTYIYETSKALTRVGHQVTVVAASEDAVTRRDRIEEGVRVIRIPDVEKNVPGPLSWKALRNSRRLGIAYSVRALKKVRELGVAYRAAVARQLEALIDEDCADIVEFAGYRGESLVWAKMPRRIPMVARVHGKTAWVNCSWTSRLVPRQRLLNAWETRELTSADHLSSVARHLVPTLLKHVDASRIHTIYNGIDTLSWSMKRDSGKQLLGEDILYVGSHLRSKGTFLLMEAAEDLRRRAGWTGRLILGGRAESQFESYVLRRWKVLPDWILALGHCSRESLASLYATAGVCCLPSYYEGFNYTGLEALASGAILVGSSAGTEELIGTDAGFPVPCGDLPALVSALRTALTLDEAARQVYRQRAMQSVHDRFEIGAIAAQTGAWYRSVIREFKSTQRPVRRPEREVAGSSSFA
jgi:glycosyltransferase involved in cell wall biosynthesis